MTRTHTYTYAIMDVSESAYEEIRSKLIKAGYADQIDGDGNLDMRGIALAKKDLFGDEWRRMWAQERQFIRGILGIKKKGRGT